MSLENQKLQPTEIIFDFYKSLENFTQFLEPYGYKVVAHNPSARRHFEGKPLKEQRQIVDQFKAYSSLFLEAAEEGVDLADERRLLGFTAKKLNLLISDEVFVNLINGDLIEIYNESLIQIYRNLALLRICGYSLLELLTYEFYELYERSIVVTNYLIEAGETLSGRNFSLAPVSLMDTPRHLMREKFSEYRVTGNVQFKAMYPVYQWPNKFFGYLVVQEASLVNEIPETIQFI